MSPVGTEPELIPSFDGTLLAARADLRSDRTPILFIDAVGTKLTPYRPLIAEFSPTHSTLNWDLRGLFSSGPPGSGGLAPRAHALDAIAVLDRYDVDDCHVIAWSSAGRIALELASDSPERVASLTLICAGYGHSFGRLLKGDLAVALPRLAGVAKYLAPLLQDRFRRFVARPEIAGLVRQSGMTSATADTGALVELLRSIAECDPRVLLETYEAVSGDPASSLLPRIKTPTFIAAAEFDQFTSRDVIREMTQQIPDASLEVFEDATHFLPIERPVDVVAAVGRFLKGSG